MVPLFQQEYVKRQFKFLNQQEYKAVKIMNTYFIHIYMSFKAGDDSEPAEMPIISNIGWN